MQINLRCFSCQTPFQVKNDEVFSALNKVKVDGLKHYNAICPRCGKTNKVSKAQLKRAAPGWKPAE